MDRAGSRTRSTGRRSWRARFGPRRRRWRQFDGRGLALLPAAGLATQTGSTPCHDCHRPSSSDDPRWDDAVIYLHHFSGRLEQSVGCVCLCL